MERPRKWLEAWELRVLTENWIPIRFQPVLFFAFAVAILHVVLFQFPPIAFEAAVGPVFTWLWIGLALVAPPMLLIAWVMIRCSGRWAFFGYWLRLAADLAQTCSFFAYFSAIVQDETPEPEDLYALIMLSATGVFLILLVVRDWVKVGLVERISIRLRRLDDRPLQGLGDHGL